MKKAIIQLPTSLKIRFNQDVKKIAKGDASRILYLYSRVDIPEEERFDSMFNIFQQDPDTDFYYSSQMDVLGGGVDVKGRDFTSYYIKDRFDPTKHETVFIPDEEFDILRPWPLTFCNW